MKILIIGSQGFIGSNAFVFFKQLGHECWGCGVSEVINDDFYFQVDRNFPDYNNIFKLQKFDICINASGSAGIAFSMEHPQDDFRMNVNNPYSLLNAIRQYNKECKFINLSSAAVYGNPVTLPVKEQDVLVPISPYGYHKMLAEQIVTEFNSIFGIPACTFRIFSAYGPGIKKQLLWDLYQKAIKSKDGWVNLFGKGNESRDFIYIDDLLYAINLIIKKGSFSGEIFNLGSGLETTIQEVASLFINIIDPSLKIKFNGSQKAGDPLFWKADMQRLALFNFKPLTTLEVGLNEYFKWIKQQEKE
jgi:UDP-glucose 4-epimerase